MTEDMVRSVFFKHYSGDDLNETLIATEDELRMTILRETSEPSESLPGIVEIILKAQSRIDLFSGVAASDSIEPVIIPMGYICYFDRIRKATLEAIEYMYENYETAQEWFKGKYLKEHLEEMLVYLTEAIEITAEIPFNIRGLSMFELELEGQFFMAALIGILGLERFNKYAEEYNKCLITLRQCQADGRTFINMTDKKES
jgi:hypothetical protein